MLHAAYDRLSSKERNEIDALVQEAIGQSGDDRIRALVETYRQRDASSLNNEMHSIVGTELRAIPSQLESYYSRYFNNRIKIVEYSEKYEHVFTDLQTRVKQIDADLISRKSEIDSLETSLQSQAATLKEWEARLSNYKANGQVAQYNSEVEDFNQNIRNYNRQIEKLRISIDEYNQKVAERNNLALQQNELIKHLDSRAAEL
jgi:chromosome segregation ATPase